MPTPLPQQAPSAHSRLWPLARFVPLLLLASCAYPRASHGLLESDAPWDSLMPPGTLGLNSLKFEFQGATLASGMRLAIEQAPTSGMVAAILTIGVGSTNDPPGKEGLAHFVEHLAFRTPVAEGKSFYQALMEMGAASPNAETNTDTTVYKLVVPAQKLPELLELYARMLSAPWQGLMTKQPQSSGTSCMWKNSIATKPGCRCNCRRPFTRSCFRLGTRTCVLWAARTPALVV